MVDGFCLTHFFVALHGDLLLRLVCLSYKEVQILLEMIVASQSQDSQRFVLQPILVEILALTRTDAIPALVFHHRP